MGTSVRLGRALVFCGLWALVFFAARDGSPFGLDDGKKLYRVHCASCHGVDGKPVTPNIPDFRRGEGIMKPDIELLEKLKKGSFSMPAYEGILTEKDILKIISYIRTFY